MKIVVLLSGCLVVLFILVGMFAPFAIISAGNVGVVRIFGKVQPDSLPPGFHMINFVANVIKMSTQVQAPSNQFHCASKDLQDVTIKMTLNYKMLDTAAPDLYQKIGLDFYEKLIMPAQQEILKAEIALHNASEILKERPTIKTKVQEGIGAWLAKYGIVITEVSLTDISFSPEYERAIENKQLEEQKALQKTYELQQAKLQAEIVAAKAKGDSDANVAMATGEAQSLRLRGEAQADYNEKVAKSLSAMLLTSKYYDRWNGVLPQTMLGDNTSALLPIQK